jgi:hypothetical protein
MSWEWVYSSNPKQWQLTVGEWYAVVQRVEGPAYVWHASIERTVAPHDRYNGPMYKDAVDARTWCLTQIAALRMKSLDRQDDAG